MTALADDAPKKIGLSFLPSYRMRKRGGVTKKAILLEYMLSFA